MGADGAQGTGRIRVKRTCRWWTSRPPSSRLSAGHRCGAGCVAGARLSKAPDDASIGRATAVPLLPRSDACAGFAEAPNKVSTGFSCATALPLLPEISAAGRSNRLAHSGVDCGNRTLEAPSLLTLVLPADAPLAAGGGGGKTAAPSRASGASGVRLGPKRARHVASSATPVSGRPPHACASPQADAERRPWESSGLA